MSRFVRATKSWVNLDLVQKITESHDREHLQLYATDGSLIDTVRSGEWDPQERFSTPIPAAAGTVAILLAVCDTDGVRPEMSDVLARELPVIAWSMGSAGVPAPIVPEMLCASEHLFLRLPDGSLLEPWNEWFANLNDAKREVLRNAAVCWDAQKEQALKRGIASQKQGQDGAEGSDA